jgi:hypothetical protein
MTAGSAGLKEVRQARRSIDRARERDEKDLKVGGLAHHTTYLF